MVGCYSCSYRLIHSRPCQVSYTMRKKRHVFCQKLIAITQQTTSTRFCLPIILFTDDVTIISDRAAQSLCPYPGVKVPQILDILQSQAQA